MEVSCGGSLVVPATPSVPTAPSRMFSHQADAVQAIVTLFRGGAPTVVLLGLSGCGKSLIASEVKKILPRVRIRDTITELDATVSSEFPTLELWGGIPDPGLVATKFPRVILPTFSDDQLAFLHPPETSVLHTCRESLDLLRADLCMLKLGSETLWREILAKKPDGSLGEIAQLCAHFIEQHHTIHTRLPRQQLLALIDRYTNAPQLTTSQQSLRLAILSSLSSGIESRLPVIAPQLVDRLLTVIQPRNIVLAVQTIREYQQIRSHNESSFLIVSLEPLLPVQQHDLGEMLAEALTCVMVPSSHYKALHALGRTRISGSLARKTGLYLTSYGKAEIESIAPEHCERFISGSQPDRVAELIFEVAVRNAQRVKNQHLIFGGGDHCLSPQCLLQSLTVELVLQKLAIPYVAMRGEDLDAISKAPFVEYDAVHVIHHHNSFLSRVMKSSLVTSGADT